jgi:hypothetical protein
MPSANLIGIGRYNDIMYVLNAKSTAIVLQWNIFTVNFIHKFDHYKNLYGSGDKRDI